MKLYELGDKKFVIKNTDTGMYSEHKTINSVFDEIKKQFENDKEFYNYLNSLSDEGKKKFLELVGYEFQKPTYDSVKEWERYTGKEFYEGIKEITASQAEEIYESIHNRDKHVCEGSYFFRTPDGDFIGIDNLNGEAYTEQFIDYETCMEWLDNPDFIYYTELDYGKVLVDGELKKITTVERMNERGDIELES